MYNRLIVLLVVVALFPSIGDTKCGMQKYVLRGRIAAEAPPADIRVYPFLEGAETTGILPGATGTPPQDFVIPNSEDSFAVDLWLNTDSGILSSGRDDCSRKAKYVDLFIVGEGVRAKRVRVVFTLAKGVTPRADAGVIKVERAQH